MRDTKKWSLAPGFHAAIFFAFFFRVTHDRLSERGTTGSLIFPPFVALAEQLPPVLTDAKHFSGSG